MCRAVIIFSAAFGLLLVAGVDACANATTINEMNTIVDNVRAPLDAMLNNDSKPIEQRVSEILTAVCNDSSVRSLVDSIAQKIANCPALAVQSNVAQISLGSLTFADLFTKFQGVDHFCGCVNPLLSAMAMNSSQAALETTSNGVKYPAVNPSVLCANPSQQNPVDFKVLVMGLAMSQQTCPRVLDYAPWLTATALMKMDQFVKNNCSNFDAAKFTCSMTESASANFTSCIAEADKITDTDTKRCGRAECVRAHINAKCQTTNDLYMRAVNMKQVVFELSAAKCDETGAGNHLVTSLITLIFVTSVGILLK